jgi:xylulokinase
MTTMQILALDVGTSSVKAAVLDVAADRPVGDVAHAHYELDRPTPDAAELPAERLWAAVTSAARAATRATPHVEAVGLSCMTPVLALLDAKHKPIGNFWTHLDRRARGAARQVWQAVGPEFLQTTGNRPLPGGITAVCYRQRMEADPYLLHDVAHYLHLNGWLALRMTGELAFDPANASFSGLFGTMTDRQWSERWCDYFEVDRAWLPRVVSGNATVGTVRAAVAAELGVPAGVPLKLGTADTSCAMLAAGMRRGDLMHEVGTTQVLAALTDTPRPAPERLTRLLGVGKAFVHVTHNPVGGAALEWMHQLCFHDQSEAEFYQKTVALARQHKSRVTLDPPYLGGDRLEIEAHRASFRDLTITTDRLDLLAAVLEAMVRWHRKALADLGVGERFERIFLTGGGADVVRQLLPEYATAEVIEFAEGSLLGVARLFK